MGIPVDHRRHNRSLEGLQANVQRLKEYRSRLIIFPKKAGKTRKGDSEVSLNGSILPPSWRAGSYLDGHTKPPPLQPELVKLASQLKGPVLPIKRQPPTHKARAVSVEDRKFSAFQTLRVARANARLVGVREKRAKKQAEEAAAAKGRGR